MAMAFGPDSGKSELPQRDITVIPFQRDKGVAGWIGKQTSPELTSSKALLRIPERSDEGKEYARTPVIILPGENLRTSQRYGLGIMNGMLQQYVIDINRNIDYRTDPIADGDAQLFLLRSDGIIQVERGSDLILHGPNFDEFTEIKDTDVIIFARDTEFKPEDILNIIGSEGIDISTIEGKKALARALLEITKSNNASMVVVNPVDMQGPDYEGEDDTTTEEPREIVIYPPRVLVN